MKQCKVCKIEKDLDQFHNKKMGKFGKDSVCIPCRKQKAADRYLENAEKIKEQTRRYKQENKELVKIRNQEYDKRNAEKIAERKRRYRDENAERISEQKKEYNSRPEVKARRNEWHKNRYETNIQYRLTVILRNRIANFLNGRSTGKKAGSAVSDLGCSINEFKLYLESKFTEGMTWDNYGENGWEVDHIIPLCKFDLTDREQFLKATHYTNMQPLWEKDNKQKNRFLK